MAAQLGAQTISIDSGAIEWPVTTSAVTAGWAATEGGNVATGAAYATTDRAMKPDHTLGVQMRITRKTLKQSGEALEQVIRRDMSGAMGQEMDKAIFLGTGADGQPLGIIPGATTYGITSTAMADVPIYNTFLAEVVAFMANNLITSPGEIRALMRPELFGMLEGTLNTITQTTEYYRLAFLLAGRSGTGTFPSNISVSSNALAAPAGTPLATSMVMTTATGAVKCFQRIDLLSPKSQLQIKLRCFPSVPREKQRA